MAIDTSGEWWKGEGFDDLAEYLRLLTTDGYPATVFRQSRCTCGCVTFALEADKESEGARRTCKACGTPTWMLDSAEYADELELESCRCPCGGDTFEVGVGYSLRADGSVKWITIGERCVKCGVLGAFVDWKISSMPTEHLFEEA